MSNDPNSETPETPNEWKQELDFTEDAHGFYQTDAPNSLIEDPAPLTDYNDAPGEGFVTQGTVPYTLTVSGKDEAEPIKAETSAAKPATLGTPFETIIKALRPFMKSYAIGNEQRVKLRPDPTADAGDLEAAIRAAGKRVERGMGNVLFVPFEEMSNKEAKKIMVSSFSETDTSDGDAQGE